MLPVAVNACAVFDWLQALAAQQAHLSQEIAKLADRNALLEKLLLERLQAQPMQDVSTAVHKHGKQEDQPTPAQHVTRTR